ncbi:MAG: hypothetical protein EOO15_19480 [Chitinophagaceae bacterium]|nr:MAG: hypothetical protein EOO15_19480 [Chitinophagaceae bacterium]
MEQSSNTYQLEKSLWTEEDFETMGWHDCHIHAISFGENFDLLFDIDYIFKWVTHKSPFDFWVSPCTLVFENVYDIVFDLNFSTGGLDIADIYKEGPNVPRNAAHIGRELEYTWKIELQEGAIQFKSVGYKQFVRRLPVFQKEQYLDLSERGGVSFEKVEAAL